MGQVVFFAEPTQWQGRKNTSFPLIDIFWVHYKAVFPPHLLPPLYIKSKKEDSNPVLKGGVRSAGWGSKNAAQKKKGMGWPISVNLPFFFFGQTSLIQNRFFFFWQASKNFGQEAFPKGKPKAHSALGKGFPKGCSPKATPNNWRDVKKVIESTP